MTNASFALMTSKTSASLIPTLSPWQVCPKAVYPAGSLLPTLLQLGSMEGMNRELFHRFVNAVYERVSQNKSMMPVSMMLNFSTLWGPMKGQRIGPHNVEYFSVIDTNTLSMAGVPQGVLPDEESPPDSPPAGFNGSYYNEEAPPPPPSKPGWLAGVRGGAAGGGGGGRV